MEECCLKHEKKKPKLMTQLFEKCFLGLFFVRYLLLLFEYFEFWAVLRKGQQKFETLRNTYVHMYKLIIIY